MPEPELEVVGIVRGSDLDRARAEADLDIVVGDDGDDPVGERQTEHTSDVCLHSLVLGVDRNRRVAQHRLGTRSRDGDVAVAVREGIAVIPQIGLLLVIDDLGVRERRLAVRAPIDDAVAAINETFLVIAHEGVHHSGGQILVHREGFLGPVAGGAQTFELLDDPAAVLLFPCPRALEELFPAHVGFGEPFLLLHLLDDLDLCRDGCVVGAGQPQRLESAHTLEAGDDVLDGMIEGVTHVQLSRDVGRGHHDRERLLLVVGMSLEVLALHPEVVDPLLERGIVGLFHFVHKIYPLVSENLYSHSLSAPSALSSTEYATVFSSPAFLPARGLLLLSVVFALSAVTACISPRLIFLICLMMSTR